MNKTSHDEKFISGISTYCDRWCEHCQFTDRCRTFAIEQEWTDEEKDIGNDAFFRKLKSSFAETKQMLIDKAEEMGIDPFAMSDEEFAEIQRREKEFVDGDELSQLGERYWRSAREIFEDPQEFLAAAEIESIPDSISVLHWFLFFIPVKIKCALHGLLDEEGFEDADQATDPQSYANGTMKICLIAIDRSIASWTNSLTPANADRVQPMIDLLEQIKTLAEERFPLARDFIRPGFDEMEIEMVM